MKKNIKNIIIVLLITTLLCFGTVFPTVSANAAGTAKITVNNTVYTASVGDTVTYTVYLRNAKAIVNGEFGINYPQTFLEVSSLSFPIVQNMDLTYNYTENRENIISFNFSNIYSSADFSNGGVLATVSFKVKAGGTGYIYLTKEAMSSMNSNDTLSDELPNATFTEQFSITATTPTIKPQDPTAATEKRPTQAPYSTSIKAKAKSKSIYVGKTTTVSANVTNGVGSTSFSSSNTKVATVNSHGVVKGISAGNVIISVKNNGVKSTVRIKVIKKSQAKKTQKITAKSYTKSFGTKAFSLEAKTSGNGKLKYKSSNKKVATVSSSGKVTIKGCGKATITIKAAATSKYKANSKKITITVKPGKLKVTGYTKGAKITFMPQPNADGYLAKVKKVGASFKKNFTAGKNRKYISIKGIPKGKYNIKISAWKKISGEKIYGKETSVLIFIG